MILFPEKKELRRQMLAQRQKLTEKEVTEKSGIICSRIKEHKVFSSSDNICLYMPVKNEVDVTLLFDEVWKKGKKIWLPRVGGEGQMQFFSYDQNTSLIMGKYNIREPDSIQMLVPDGKTLVVMPGAVFSKNRNRIGYGGGFYDRYLEENTMCNTLAVCYDFQIVENLPAEAHDRKPKIIISENQIIYEEESYN